MCMNFSQNNDFLLYGSWEAGSGGVSGKHLHIRVLGLKGRGGVTPDTYRSPGGVPPLRRGETNFLTRGWSAATPGDVRIDRYFSIGSHSGAVHKLRFSPFLEILVFLGSLGWSRGALLALLGDPGKAFWLSL